MGFFFRAYNRVRRLNWLQCQTSRQVDVTQIEGWGWRGVLLPRSTFFWNLYRQVWYILDHTHTKKTSCKRSGGAAALYDSDRDECVIVVEVTGADSTSVQFEMRRWTDRRRGGKKTCLKLDRCQNLKGSRTVGRIWATDKSKLTHIEALKKKKSRLSPNFFVLNCIWLLAPTCKKYFCLIFSCLCSRLFWFIFVREAAK